MEVPAPTLRFFKAEDYQYLLSKTISALDLQSSPEGGGQASGVSEKKNCPKGKVEFFPPSTEPIEKAFPFPKDFQS